MLNMIKEITKTFFLNQYKHEKQHIQKKQEHTHVKNLKRQLMTKDFLWILKLHAGNWNEWPLVLST